MAKSVDVLAVLERRKEKAGSWRALARELGVSAAYMSDVVRGNREPGDSILRPLGLRKVVKIERTYEVRRADNRGEE